MEPFSPCCWGTGSQYGRVRGWTRTKRNLFAVPGWKFRRDRAKPVSSQEWAVQRLLVKWRFYGDATSTEKVLPFLSAPGIHCRINPVEVPECALPEKSGS